MQYLRVATMIIAALMIMIAAGCDVGSTTHWSQQIIPTAPPAGTYRSLDSAVRNADKVLCLSLRYGRTNDSIPLQITLFHNMEELQMCGNRITDIPEFLSRTNIKYLWLRNNYIDSIRAASIPSTINVLCLDSNRISSIPVEISRLKNTVILTLAHNNIRTFSPEIRLLADSLSSLNIGDNPLEPGMIDSLKKWLPKTWVHN